MQDNNKDISFGNTNQDSDKGFEDAEFTEVEVEDTPETEYTNHEYREPQTEQGTETTLLPTDKERTWGVAMWATTFIGFVTVIGFLIPIVMWLMKKESSEYIDNMGREITNFLITYTIYSVVASLLVFVLIGLVLLPIVAIMFVIFMIVGTLKAAEGKVYRTPLIFRLM